ncbi:MAG: glycosyltransferase family 2 protein [candidate division Zixibacteria bacterium]|nr:glycosyltransferase family 2 protein [Candidatus Tariuqbacter arcticus]
MKYKIDRLELPPLEEVDLTNLDLSGGVGVMLPAYNEEENIERAVKNSVEMLASFTDNYEVLVVNDASTDKTGRILEDMSRDNSHIRVVHHKKNLRLGGAIRTGFKESGKEIIFYCDSDSPVDMWDVKRVLPLMATYDLVAGYRLTREERFIRKVYSKTYNSIIRSLFGFKLTDINFSFKLIKKKVFENIELHSNGGFIDAEFISEILRGGFRAAEVGVHYYPRATGESTMASPSVILEIMAEMWKYYQRMKKGSS